MVDWPSWLDYIPNINILGAPTTDHPEKKHSTTTLPRGVYIVKWHWRKNGWPTWHHCLLVADQYEDNPTGHLSGEMFDWGSEKSWFPLWKPTKENTPWHYSKTAAERVADVASGRLEYAYQGCTYWTSENIWRAVGRCGSDYTFFENNCQHLTKAVVDLLVDYPHGLTEGRFLGETHEYQLNTIGAIRYRTASRCVIQ